MGGSLLAYSSDQSNQLRYKIPLSKAKKLMCEGVILAESNQTDIDTSSTTLLSQLDSVISARQDEEDVHTPVLMDPSLGEHGFQLVFDEETIQFYCDSIEERNAWITVIEVMVCKLPKLPHWIIT